MIVLFAYIKSAPLLSLNSVAGYHTAVMHTFRDHNLTTDSWKSNVTTSLTHSVIPLSCKTPNAFCGTGVMFYWENYNNLCSVAIKLCSCCKKDVDSVLCIILLSSPNWPQVTSPVLQTSSHVPVAAASLGTLCATARMTVAMALMRWSALRPPVVPVSSSAGTPHASQPAGCATMMSTAR